MNHSLKMKNFLIIGLVAMLLSGCTSPEEKIQKVAISFAAQIEMFCMKSERVPYREDLTKINAENARGLQVEVTELMYANKNCTGKLKIKDLKNSLEKVFYFPLTEADKKL